MWNIKGDKMSLLKEHGHVQVDRCIGSLFSKIPDDVLDINRVNEASTNGMLFVKDNGTILNECSAGEEQIAKYKIVPTGLFLKGTNTPIFASFLKFKDKEQWQGVYLGTGEQLFKMYKQHYPNPDKFDNSYINIFCGDKASFGIIGFGLKELLKNRELDVRYTTSVGEEVNSEPTLYDSMRKAIEKCLAEANTCDNSTKGKRDAKKAMQKAEMLKSRLEKMEAKQQKKQKSSEEVLKNKATGKVENTSGSLVGIAGDTVESEVKSKVRSEVEPVVKSSNSGTSDVASNQVKEKPSGIISKTTKSTEVSHEIISESEVKKAKSTSENISRKTETEETKENKLVGKSVVKEKKSRLKDIKSVNGDVFGNDDESLHSHPLCSEGQNYELLVTRFLDSLYKRLLYKENWMANGRYRLDFYIRNLIKILEYERQQAGNKKCGNGYVYSGDKARCILNLGVLDMYGNEIYILDSTPNQGDFRQKDLSMVDSKFELLGIGFNQDDIKNLPEIFDMRKLHKEATFDANADDFDLMDIVRLNHLIEERRSRFPKKYIEESSKVLCDRLKDSIIQAVKISKTDCRYIVPKYDFFRHQVQFMIPFHLDKELHDIPELAIIVGKNKGLWCVYTILPIEDALADARILFRPTSWLRM